MATKKSGGSKSVKATKAAPSAKAVEKTAAKAAAKKSAAKTVPEKRSTLKGINASAADGSTHKPKKGPGIGH